MIGVYGPFRAENTEDEERRAAETVWTKKKKYSRKHTLPGVAVLSLQRLQPTAHVLACRRSRTHSSESAAAGGG